MKTEGGDGAGLRLGDAGPEQAPRKRAGLAVHGASNPMLLVLEASSSSAMAPSLGAKVGGATREALKDMLVVDGTDDDDSDDTTVETDVDDEDREARNLGARL